MYGSNNALPTLNFKRILAMSVAGVATLLVLFLPFNLAENVDASEIAVIQAPFSGKLSFYCTQGVEWQGGGRVTSYHKRTTYEFETQVRFNDGGHGVMKGSVQWEMPCDEKNLTALHQKFGSPEAIQSQLIEKITNKAVYMTGPLMSSKESYAEKRNYLINYVEDQIANGVYRTVQHEVKVNDPITGQEKTAVIVDIQMQNGVPIRQEEAVLAQFGIKTFNFAINSLVYDEQVEKQIQQQQQITMNVQTAIAEARQAEQRKLTVEQQGQADAAKAKWEQEVVKAKEVTAAQQRLAVAELDRKSAEQKKAEQILLGEGEARRRELVMQADGALDKKLDTYKETQKYWADAIKGYAGNWVPTVVSGGGTSGASASGAMQLMEMLGAKAAMDLGLELKANGARKTGGQ